MGLANLWIQFAIIQGPRPQRPVDGSAEIIAVFHALHRLLAPRHPPHALSSLAALAPSSNPRLRGVRRLKPPNHPPSCIARGEVTTLLSTSGTTEFAFNSHALTTTVTRPRKNALVLVIATSTAHPDCQRTAGLPMVGQLNPSAVLPLTGSRCTLSSAATLIQTERNLDFSV